MSTKLKKVSMPPPAVMAALAQRSQQAAPPVQGIPGGAPDPSMPGPTGMKKGGKTKKYAKGGSVTRGDGIAERGHTKGRNV